MKGNLFTIVFFIIFMILAGISDAETEALLRTRKIKHIIEDSFMSAVDSAVNQLEISFEHDERLDKEKAVETFFNTLYAGLNILDDPFLREQLALYIPVIAVVADDGFYIFSNEEYVNSGKIEIKRIWSDLIPFSYEDEYFIYRFELSDIMTIYDKKGLFKDLTPVISLTYKSLQEQFSKYSNAEHIIRNEEDFSLFKQNVIVSRLEECLSYYINRNNYIAKRHGITYHFYLPAIDSSEWIRAVTKVSMIVFFQGYPYNNGRNIYNQFIISGASIKRLSSYYIVQEDYFYVYHKKGCILLNNKEISKMAYSSYECAESGAYPCSICN